MDVSCVEQYLIGFVCRRALPNCTPNATAALEAAAADADRGSFGLWPPFGCSQLPNRRSRSEATDEESFDADESVSDEITDSPPSIKESHSTNAAFLIHSGRRSV